MIPMFVQKRKKMLICLMQWNRPSVYLDTMVNGFNITAHPLPYHLQLKTPQRYAHFHPAAPSSFQCCDAVRRSLYAVYGQWVCRELKLHSLWVLQLMLKPWPFHPVRTGYSIEMCVIQLEVDSNKVESHKLTKKRQLKMCQNGTKIPPFETKGLVLNGCAMATKNNQGIFCHRYCWK